MRYNPECSTHSSFILNLGKAFDILNSSQLKELMDGRCAFGLKRDEDPVLTFLTHVFPLYRFLNVKHLLSCQKSFIIAGYAISQLFKYVWGKYRVNFLLTAKSNQDCL